MTGITEATRSTLTPDARSRIDPIAGAELPTRFGDFQVVAFAGDHLALVRGDPSEATSVPLRIHSECLTGDVLGSLRCDCRDQLIQSLEILGRAPLGIVIYLRQEGRGIGLANKIKAYALQDRGHDTIDANLMLGFGEDERDYRVAAQILRALGVRAVSLMTNNPAKVRGLRENGIEVVERIPVVVPTNRYNERYLATKRERAGHWLAPLKRAKSASADPRSSASVPSLCADPGSPASAGAPAAVGEAD